MTTTLARLPLLDAGTHPEGHLPECDLAGGDWRTCQWCLSAMDTPEVRRLADLIADAAKLLEALDAGSVAWLVAAVELERAADAIGDPDSRIPSVEQLTRELQGHLAQRLATIEEHMAECTAAGGPIEARCIEASGTFAAIALQTDAHAGTLAGLPAGVRRVIAGLRATLSADTQLAQLGASLGEPHRHAMPRLATQPEWQVLDRAVGEARRPPEPGPQAPPDLRPTPRSGPAAGSLEALVVESVIDDVAAELVEVARSLPGLRPPVTISRPPGDPPFSSRTRSLVWRRAHIDWTLTFIDSGRAHCWNPRVVDRALLCDVPWTVALAIETGRRMGFMSAVRDD